MTVGLGRTLEAICGGLVHDLPTPPRKGALIPRGQALDGRGSVFGPESQKPPVSGLLGNGGDVFPQAPDSLQPLG